MKSLELFLAFVFGCGSVMTFALVANNIAQQNQATDQGSIQNRIKVLQERVRNLEQKGAAGKLAKRFVAPFEVDDKYGKRIFYVSPERDVEFYRDGKRVTLMSAAGEIGTLWILTSTPDLWANATADRLRINESGKTRTELGRGDQGTFHLLFFSKDGKRIAGIGELPESHNGQMMVYNSAGDPRAKMMVGEDDRGLVEVLGGQSSQTLIRLTEGNNGGYLMICSAANCNKPVVEAGDGGGFGVVRTGPQMFEPGVGLTGAPQSFLEGKH
jgi:hypothetical protein